MFTLFGPFCCALIKKTIRLKVRDGTESVAIDAIVVWLLFQEITFHANFHVDFKHIHSIFLFRRISFVCISFPFATLSIDF